MSGTPAVSETVAEGRTLVVTIDRPPDNLIDIDVLAGIAAAIERLESSPELASGVVRGSGRVFSKGYDLRAIRGHASAASHRAELLQANDVCMRLRRCPKPWIAAVNGHCLGAGLEIVLACHFSICADSARLGLPELGHGLLPGLGGIHRLTRLVGRTRALDIVLVGELLEAGEAARIGLVTRTVPAASLDAHVTALARSLSLLDPARLGDALRLVGLAESASDGQCVEDLVAAIVRPT